LFTHIQQVLGQVLGRSWAMLFMRVQSARTHKLNRSEQFKACTQSEFMPLLRVVCRPTSVKSVHSRHWCIERVPFWHWRVSRGKEAGHEHDRTRSHHRRLKLVAAPNASCMGCQRAGYTTWRIQQINSVSSRRRGTPLSAPHACMHAFIRARLVLLL
jgi:hypothetical protein